MPPRRIKLIEVALPLEAINAASAREKSIRHGHPSTLHLWWARRPLAACRAVLFAQLVDDPSAWPDRFPTEEDQAAERKRLHTLIGGTKAKDYRDGLIAWERSNDESVLDAARYEIARSLAWNRGEETPADPDAVRAYLVEHLPPVYDPFCGGGSIPLEAQRLGLVAHGSDINPVAVLISKATIEFPPKFKGRPPVNPEARKRLADGGAWNARGAQGLAEDVRYYGRWMRDEAARRVGHLYPDVELPPAHGGGKATVIAWLWARTVASPNPAAKGARVPLVSSFMLSTKAGKEAWVEPVRAPAAPDGYRFEVRTGKLSAEQAAELKEGTINRKGGYCWLTGSPIAFKHIRAEGKAGRMGARLMAIVAEGQRGRVYLTPDEEHERTASFAQPKWTPDTELPKKALGFRVQEYGMTRHADLFTPRQLVALATFSCLVEEARERITADALSTGLDPDGPSLNDGGIGIQAYADAVAVYLTLTIGRLADLNNNLCQWRSDPAKQHVGHLFTRQAVSMIWDYAEANPLGSSAGGWKKTFIFIPKALDHMQSKVALGASGHVFHHDAQERFQLPRVFLSSDPPYYDNIAYSDLSDFFYVWLRQSLRNRFPKLFKTVLVPKDQELVASPSRHGSKEKAERFFLEGMTIALRNMVMDSHPDYPAAIYYAFKQSEVKKEGVTSTGWATFLTAVLVAGFQVNGTWPMRTELSNRMRGIGSNALASSIVLVCRKRPADAPSVGRAEFLRALRRELPPALAALQRSAIAPVDMAQASLGPGMAVFSRYREVLEADDTPVDVRTALMLINKALDDYLAEQEGDFDSRTRFALAWFAQFGFEGGRYGEAEVLATAKGVSVKGVAEAGVLEARGGRVRLLRRDELPDDWDPWRDSSLTVWEGCQHMIRRLERGEAEAAWVARRLGPYAETARDLAYRLYQLCDRKGWAEEARAYNGLVVAWPGIAREAERLHDAKPAPRQAALAV